MNREELDKFVGAVINKGCSINMLLNINLKHNNMFKDENLIYVLSGLIKASGVETPTIKEDSLKLLKESGMLSDDFYNKLNNSLKDGVVSLEDVLSIETSTELTMEQKQAQTNAIQSLEKANSADMTAKDLENLSVLTNDQNCQVSEDIKNKAKTVVNEKANEAKLNSPELETNSTQNIETYQNLLRPLSPKFSSEPKVIEASSLIETAIMEGQLSLGAASEILSSVGFNPAEVTDLLKSSNSPSPDFNVDDTSATQATAGDRLTETLAILSDEQTTLTYEENPDPNNTFQDEPRIAMVKNYINNNLITFEEVKTLQEAGKLPLNDVELGGIETMETIDETSAEAIEDDLNDEYFDDLQPEDLHRFLDFIDYAMENDAEMVMTKKNS